MPVPSRATLTRGVTGGALLVIDIDGVEVASSESLLSEPYPDTRLIDDGIGSKVQNCLNYRDRSGLYL